MLVTPPHVLVHAASSGDFTMKVNVIVYCIYYACNLYKLLNLNAITIRRQLQRQHQKCKMLRAE